MPFSSNIAPLAISEAQYSSRLLQRSGKSLSTGRNQEVGVIEDFIGSSENDTCAITRSTLRSTINATNMLEIGQNRILEGLNALTRGLSVIGNSGGANLERLQLLQTQLDASKAQLDTMLRSADFDNIGLFSGEAKNLEVSIGTSITDTVKVSLPDLLNGKLYRTSITAELNKWIVANPGQTTYYTNAGQIDTDVKNNVNLIACCLAGDGGSGTQGRTITDQQFADALYALSPKSKRLLDQLAPVAKADLIAKARGNTFINASPVQLQAILARDAESTRIGGQITDMLGAVADRDTPQNTANATRDRIMAVPGLPQVAKDAVIEGAHGIYLNNAQARDTVRSIALRALIGRSKHEIFLRAKMPMDVFFSPGAIDLPDVLDVQDYNEAVQESDTICAASKAASAAAAAVPGATIDTMRNTLLNNNSRDEVVALLQDNMPTNISTGVDAAALRRNRLITRDVLTNASNTLRQVKATIISKKEHIIFAADSLRRIINVTQKSADAYLKTNYLQAVQEFSHQLQALMASLNALQGNNRSTEQTVEFMHSTLES
ncbi:MAG: hypothetical protein AB8B66_00930 [Rickettsiaceae bacterium]